VGGVLALGLTRYPLLAGVDDHMADLLKAAARDLDNPAEAKDVANWKPLARQERDDDGGTKAAGVPRRRLLDGLSRCREELDAFRPDVSLVSGDDQYENFRAEVIPSFCVLICGNTRLELFGALDYLKIPNLWGLASDEEFEIQGFSELARSLARDVLGLGVDVAHSYEKREGLNFPHVFANTQVFLDWDAAGANFPYPIDALAVNCYGEHVIGRRGGFAPFAADYDAWARVTTREVVAAGQHEILNWFCLLGAVSQLGLRLDWNDFVTTEIFNPNKAFAVYK
jgi:hypothetical protein